MKTEQTNMQHSTIVDLTNEQIQAISGGQAAASYCVYSSNGSVGVHDFSQMVSRPLATNETCGG